MALKWIIAVNKSQVFSPVTDSVMAQLVTREEQEEGRIHIYVKITS
jgi:hypothetical protein